MMKALAVFTIAFVSAFVVARSVATPTTTSLPVARITHAAVPPFTLNSDFSTNARENLLATKTDFIEANLASMQLNVYRSGQKIFSTPIKTKGREGSWWQTPAGLYGIENKEITHFSSFGHVFQPWSMQFDGNFFIHGWPTYANGTPVSSAYSGGCIRLNTDDAKSVYALSHVGMPVLVSDEQKSDSFTYATGVVVTPPDVQARAYLAADLFNNFVFFSKNSKAILPIASITKLVTALIASENINLDREIKVSPLAIVPTSLPRLHPQETVPAFDLLYPLLTESSNEAARAFALTLGQDNFVNLMNARAHSIGMQNTFFADAAGSGATNVASAEDLYTLGRYLMLNRSFVLSLTTGHLDRHAYGESYFHDLKNFNLFAEDQNFAGGKIGKTSAAGETMLAIFNVNFQGSSRPVIIIVLGSSNVQADIQAIRAAIVVGFHKQIN